ncbi:RagB/SusD family nutrient uptake outer membrane protein [Cytophagaceae bacterium DM2B3-1]|uniref:RagB/SusD family nutrient uptake outer membrane protein n=1 Tax=Xanthocytophaga flava TaxID=3048013 RepID=A0ABT7CS54_9BACT|nr:RagB/SusD family nutrient uptake outer membrane protein [Xanthocytophaga flavus]MDJ1471697.1 RagB/SusD family nutrient uptake outer membrane protein [Xanthocytophaga flavus]MDJ1496577.1 RagB/SusD family nutrient uptake outer membrane protein [Xanthocytophaga flavus]
MKRIHTYIIGMGLAALSFSACNNDFLDRQPSTSIGSDNFFNGEQDLKLYINNMYNFPGWGIYNDDQSTDNAATTGATEIKLVMGGNPTASAFPNGWNWEQLRSVNYFLANFRKAPLSEDVLNHYEGLARFFRAQFYVNKVKRYSDVPWYDQVINTNDTELLMKERDPRSLVVEKIMEDYAFAAEHVNETSESGAVNRWIVKAYQAKFALYEGTYRRYHSELALESTASQFLQLAADVSKNIMDGGKFRLYTTGSPTQDYMNLFVQQNLNGNPEVLLATYSENGIRNSGWNETVFGNYEVSPTKDLLQDYLMADGSYYSSQSGYTTFPFVKEFENRDPRLSQTYAYPGFNLLNVDTYSQGGGLYVQQLAKNFTGYHQIKGFVNDPSTVVQNNLDIPVLRYAEILLTYAEAKAELGTLTQGDLDQSINLLRNRVGMPQLSLTPAVDPVQDAKYPNTSTAQRPVLLEIRRERRIEMALEGYRYDDLMRWNAGKLLEKEQEGIYFSGLGKHDLTGDGVPDIILLNNSESIPAVKEKNALGKDFIYYRTGSIGQDAGVFLKNGTSGTVQTSSDNGTFQEPKSYYRPVPQNQVLLNPNLKQIFGW